MIVAGIKIKNFIDLYESVECKFHSGINLLIGPNGSGKTAICTVLQRCLQGEEEVAQKIYGYDSVEIVSENGTAYDTSSFVTSVEQVYNPANLHGLLLDLSLDVKRSELFCKMVNECFNHGIKRKSIEYIPEDNTIQHSFAKQPQPGTFTITYNNGKKSTIYVNVPDDFRYLSDGEYSLCILYAQLLLAKGGLVIINKPETNLHIEWQEMFLDNLSKICKLNGLQAIVETHSPNIINDRCEDIVSLDFEMKGN